MLFTHKIWNMVMQTIRFYTMYIVHLFLELALNWRRLMLFPPCWSIYNVRGSPLGAKNNYPSSYNYQIPERGYELESFSLYRTTCVEENCSRNSQFTQSARCEMRTQTHISLFPSFYFWAIRSSILCSHDMHSTLKVDWLDFFGNSQQIGW